MPGRVCDDELTLGRAEIAVGNIDRDALFTFGFQTIGQVGQQRRMKAVDLFAAGQIRTGFDFLQLIFIDHFGIVQQAANERAFSIIHATASQKAEHFFLLMLSKVSMDVGGNEVRCV